MELSESIERILQNNGGELTIDKLIPILEGRYARKTIIESLKHEKYLFTFDGRQVRLLHYPLKQLIQILEHYSEKFPNGRFDIFYFGAYALFLKRKYPDLDLRQSIDAHQSRLNPLGLNPRVRFTDLPEELIRVLDDHFSLGYLEHFDTKSFYYFTQGYYEKFIHSSSMGRGFISTPGSLIELICQLIPRSNNLKVYNPAAGILNLLTAIQVHSGVPIEAVASEINEQTYQIGKLFAATNNFSPEFHLENSLYELVNLPDNYFDAVVSVPPFNESVFLDYPYYDSFKDLALDLIVQSFRKLRSGGTALFLVADTVLFGQNPNYKRFREEIIEQKLIQSVVSLPVNLYYPILSVKSSLLILKKDLYLHSVRVIDASSEKFYSILRDKSVSLKLEKIMKLLGEENGINPTKDSPTLISEPQARYGLPSHWDLDYVQLRNKDFSLNLNDYIGEYLSPWGSDYCELGEIVDLLKLPLNQETTLPYLRITDLNGQVIDDFNKFLINPSKIRGSVLAEEAFLVGLMGGRSKPTWCISNQKVEISPNMVALKPKPGKVNPEYLLQELNADYVQQQMEQFSVGSTTLKHLRRDDLLKIKIKLPSPEEQQRLVQERKKFIAEQSLGEKPVTKSVSGEKIIKTLKHEIQNILKGPEGVLNMLPSFLETYDVALTTPCSTDPGARSIAERINSAKEDIAAIYRIMDNLGGILLAESSSIHAQDTEMVAYIKDRILRYKDHHPFEYLIGSNGNYKHPEEIWAEIDREQFNHLIYNIITNALKHGGALKSLPLLLIVNLVTPHNGENEELEIHFMNNGEKMSSNFTLEEYKRFSRKSGNSTGQGIGGFIIDRVIRNHHGQLSLMPPSAFVIQTINGNLDFNSNFEIVITLPKKQ